VHFAAALGNGAIAVYRVSGGDGGASGRIGGRSKARGGRRGGGGGRAKKAPGAPPLRIQAVWWNARLYGGAACVVATVQCCGALLGGSGDMILPTPPTSSLLVSGGNDGVFHVWRWGPAGIPASDAPLRSWAHVAKAGINWAAGTRHCGGLLCIADTSKRLRLYFDLLPQG
jgi:hypothetical protein